MSKVIEVAIKEVGVQENPPNSNNVKYNTWIYGKVVSGAKYPWCGAFVSWCYSMAGFQIRGGGYAKGFIGCQYAVANIKKWGRLITEPKAGDVVFFDWEGDGKFDHTGLFVSNLPNGNFKTIEGNTAVGNDSNGGSVMERERKYKNVIFVRPHNSEHNK